MRPLDPDEPRSIGAYRLLGRLGAGGMGRVYLGRSAGGRTVAVKVVHPHYALDDEFRERFRREVAAARRVGGAWTAPVLDADPDASVPWVATGYVAGPPLSAAVTGHGPLPGRAVRALGGSLAEALTAVHALGLVHRDVKPSNVLLALDGPRLIDFGIARATDGTASLTSTGVSVGSPGYMSPEAILGKGVTGAADVFSLGAVLAYAATGSAPFRGDSSATLLYKVVHEEPELDELHGEVKELVAGCLAKDPAARPVPGEIADALAPGGAAALVGAGWLPGPLVEEVSRAAVSLLDLEPDAPVGSPEAASGPVPFSSPAIGTFGPPVEPSGGFGAPHPGPATAPGPYGTAPGTASGPYGSAPGTASGPYGTAPGPPAPDAAGSAPPAGGAPREEPPEPGASRPGRRRRVTCSVTLTLGLALVAVTLGTAVLFDLWPGAGGNTEDNATDTPPAASARPSTGPPGTTGPGATPGTTGPTATPGGRTENVPEAFIGTWNGPYTLEFAGSEIESGRFVVVLKAGKTGARIGTVSQYNALGGLTCVDDLVLRDATATRLTVDGTSNGELSTCTSGTHKVELRLDGSRLRYLSNEPRAGNPKAVLTKGG
ncbi:protein kinase [Streptomyces sp. NPDC051018]|uniref:serine/threonine-protein kinase n=1 Tax=Streptomyces sp. NPDC051018 TaxID=3365639 RepID=UPI0037BA0EB4